MRTYVIEDRIRFEPGENLLTALATTEKVQLSLIASRLLEQLLLAKGQVVSREEIFSTTFDAWGAASTNNNLNQYILALRKQINYLGLHEEVIKTIPRVGFSIPEYIQVAPGDAVIIDESIAKKQIIASNKTSYISNNKWSIGYLLFLAAIALGIAADYLYELHSAVSWNDIEMTVPTEIASQEGCHLFILPGSSPEVREYYNKLLQPLKGMQCDQNNKGRFYIRLKKSPYNKQRVFIMRCEDIQANPTCFSYYTSHEGEE